MIKKLIYFAQLYFEFFIVFILLMLVMPSAIATLVANESLIQKLNHTHTFASQFEQQVLDEHGQVLQHSSGNMQFSKYPSLFYWNVLSPSPQKMWYRNHEFVILDIELEQATIKKFTTKQDPNMLPVMLLTGDAAEALKNFSVEVVGNKYILKPKKISKDNNNLLIRLVLELDAQGSVRKIRYQTSLGQMTEITFINAKINRPLNQALFYPSLKNADIVTE